MSASPSSASKSQSSGPFGGEHQLHPQSVQYSSSAPASPMQIAESIKALHELHKDGGLTEAEFAQAKQHILDSASSSSAATARSSHNSSEQKKRDGQAKRRKSAVSKKSSKRSSSSSSSSSNSSRFIVVPRANVWRALDDERSDAAASEENIAGSPLYRGATPRIPSMQEADEKEPLLVCVGDLDEKSKGVPALDSVHLSPPTFEFKAPRYGTFLQRYGPGGVPRVRAPAETFPKTSGRTDPDDQVHVRYFNSRGMMSDRFSEVILSEEQRRPAFFLYKGVARRPAAGSFEPPSTSAEVPSHSVQDLSPEMARLWDGLSRSHSSCSSYLEQSLNWYWVDVTGRDASRRKYDSALRYLTQKFNICKSFLLERDHMLVLPQVCESPHHPGQYLLNLRVATQRISIEDDSVIQLTNRWIIVVDLNQHVVLTLHRVDTAAMAQLRAQWKRVMEESDVSFQEFLLKIIDDAIVTYQLSLDVHADLLDRCESKLFLNDHSEKLNNSGGAAGARSQAIRMEDARILHHFAASKRSDFLRELLDEHSKYPPNKGQMNSFLHHLHRRTSVQHRMLNVTQGVLAQAFTKLQLCSKELANQMCGSCNELSGRALEVCDDAKTLLDLHISLQSFRTNELMAVLTRVSLFFTPCTFLAGVYGMNFAWFPELQWKYGYPAFWLVCLVLVLAMRWAFV